MYEAFFILIEEDINLLEIRFIIPNMWLKMMHRATKWVFGCFFLSNFELLKPSMCQWAALNKRYDEGYFMSLFSVLFVVW